MPEEILVILLFTALGGWLTALLTIRLLIYPHRARTIAGISIQGFLPYLQEQYAVTAGTNVQAALISGKILENNLSNQAIFEQLKPVIEQHVDHFLQEKLSQVFPLLYKFMGEKTLAQFKQAFLAEIDILFPELMKKYGSEWLNTVPVASIVTGKIATVTPDAMQATIHQYAGKTLLQYQFLCTLAGLVTGGIIVLMLWLIR